MAGISAALAAIAVGLVGGFLQGFAITRLKVPPFVVTLGGMSVFRGAALLFAAGGPISGFEPAFVWWGQGDVFGQVPVPVIIFLAFAVLAHIVLRYTRYGRQVYAVGGNPEAARLSGLNVRRSSPASTSSSASSPGSAPSCCRRGSTRPKRSPAPATS